MQNKELSRGQFLKQMGMSSKALMAFYCMGTLAACSTEDDPKPVNNNGNSGSPVANGITGTSSGAKIDFTVDLTHANFSKLKNDGEFAYAGDVIIANVGGVQGFVALSKKCTHQGTTVEFRSSSGDFRCPNHGSEYSVTGTVTKSPASSPLTLFKAVLSADKNSLKITA